MLFYFLIIGAVCLEAHSDSPQRRNLKYHRLGLSTSSLVVILCLGIPLGIACLAGVIYIFYICCHFSTVFIILLFSVFYFLVFYS
jgi:hypothetical protein